MWDKYLVARTIGEAVDYLEKETGNATVIGGGTDLMPQYRSKVRSGKCLVDITRIPEMNKITMENGIVTIGGAVTHTEIAESDIIQKFAYTLACACGTVGSPQIRNQGTIAGNLVNAQPAADGAIALAALDGQATIVSAEGRRTVPVIDLFAGVGKSNVDSSREIIEKIFFHALIDKEGEESAFERLALRKSLSLPIINAATSLKVTDGKINWIRIAIGPVSQTPYRPYEIEKEMIDYDLNLDNINIFAGKIAESATPRNSTLRGSADYRKAMVKVLVKRLILKAEGRVECKK